MKSSDKLLYVVTFLVIVFIGFKAYQEPTQADNSNLGCYQAEFRKKCSAAETLPQTAEKVRAQLDSYEQKEQPEEPKTALSEDINLRELFIKTLNAGSNHTFEISGSCSGTANLEETPIRQTQLKNATLLAQTSTLSVSSKDCKDFNGTSSAIDYYNNSYALLATQFEKNYVFYDKSKELPSFSKIGETGTLSEGVNHLSQDSNEIIGYNSIQFEISKSLNNLTVFSLTFTEYDSVHKIVSMITNRWHVSKNQDMQLFEVEMQDFGSSKRHILMH